MVPLIADPYCAPHGRCPLLLIRGKAKIGFAIEHGSLFVLGHGLFATPKITSGGASVQPGVGFWRAYLMVLRGRGAC